MEIEVQKIIHCVLEEDIFTRGNCVNISLAYVTSLHEVTFDLRKLNKSS